MPALSFGAACFKSLVDHDNVCAASDQESIRRDGGGQRH